MPELSSKKAIERINSVRRRAITVARRPPAAGTGLPGLLGLELVRCPICNGRLKVITSYKAVSRSTTVIDGLSSTLYGCLKDRLLWIHEVGGIAKVDSWLGPVPAQENELEPPANIPPSPPSRNR